MQISNLNKWTYSESFINSVNEYANTLWNYICQAKTYSFNENPLPVFYLLHAAYCDYDIQIINEVLLYSKNTGFPDDSLRAQLLDEFPKECFHSIIKDWEVFDEFCWSLNYGNYYEFRGTAYKQIHPFVVDFFIQKYVESLKTDHELSESFMDQIWQAIIDEQYDTTCFYIPYSGLNAVALYDMNSCYTTHRCSYYCIEDDPILSLIAKVRMCSYGHNYNIVHSPTEFAKNEEITNRPYENTMVSVPPFNKKVKKVSENGEVVEIDVAEDIITKYIEDRRFEAAYFVFPMSFAYDPNLKKIREVIIKRKLIKSIGIIPEGSFMTSSTAGLLISLDKNNKSDKITYSHSKNGSCDVQYSDIVSTDFSLTPESCNATDILISKKVNVVPPIQNTKINEQTPIPNTESDHNKMSFSLISDLMHCLGPSFNRINNIADINSDNDDFKSVRDNLAYIARVIKSFGADFESSKMSPNEICVNEFFNDFYSSHLNCNSAMYNIEYQTFLSNDTTFMIDEDMIRILLDTILDNAYRHGFKKARSNNSRVGISTSCKKMNDIDFIHIEVANNGFPLPEDFTLEKFITRDYSSGSNGNSGLGGNHIYNIAKKHNGYINIASSAKWNVIFDILIPAAYLGDEDFDKTIKLYDHAKKCL